MSKGLDLLDFLSWSEKLYLPDVGVLTLLIVQKDRELQVHCVDVIPSSVESLLLGAIGRFGR